MARRVVGAIAASLSAALPAVAAEEGGGVGKLLITPQFGTIFWTVVTFVALAVFLRAVAWKPLLGAIQERERAIRESQEQMRRDREEAAALLAQQRELLAQSRRERAEAVEAGRQEAERLRAEILEEARRQREQMLAQAEAQIEIGLRQAQGAVRQLAADLAIRAAAKILAVSLDEAAQRRLVEEYLSDLERQAAGSGPTPS